VADDPFKAVMILAVSLAMPDLLIFVRIKVIMANIFPLLVMLMDNSEIMRLERTILLPPFLFGFGLVYDSTILKFHQRTYFDIIFTLDMRIRTGVYSKKMVLS